MDYACMKAEADKRYDSFQSLLQPVIEIGMGTCGRAAGAEKIAAAVENFLKQRRVLGRIIHVGCIGMCYMEPIMAIRKPGNPFIYYGNLTTERTEEILSSYLLNDNPQPQLALCTMGEGSIEGIPSFYELPMIRSQVRIVLRNCGLIDPEVIDHYIARGGYSGLYKALLMTPEDVIQEVKKAGLRGRGGAGFPTWRKLQFSSEARADEKYVICNGSEGDPGAFSNLLLLESDPHMVLEGMLIAAYAIGAKQGYIYCPADYSLALERLQIALRQMNDVGLLGDNILNSSFNFHLKIKEGAGAYICGEESALIEGIEGKRGTPRLRPPFPPTAGVWSYPTIVNNVETLACITPILQYGADCFKKLGTDNSKGTKIFSLSGNIKRSGAIEVPFGITLQDLIFTVGGGTDGDKRIKAVQIGGPGGGCVPAALLNSPVDHDSLHEFGAAMGSGSVIVIDEDTCMVDIAHNYLDFAQKESCGKCMPCRLGTRQMLDILEDICKGRGKPEDLELLEDLSEGIRKGSLCGLGQTAPNPVLTTIRYFSSEYDAHIRDKRCPAVSCSDLFVSPCQHACPIEMDIPAYITLIKEGRLDDAYRVLLRNNPFPSVCGRVCEQPCRQKCRRGSFDEPVAIKNLKRYITDNGRPPQRKPVTISRNKRVAVIGAGPAGLTTALDLRMSGYEVAVYEALPEPGGMLRYGIPQYRLPKEILKKEVNAILDLGIDFYPSVHIGIDLPWVMILDQYDTVFLALGAQRSAKLGIKGEDMAGVEGALEFLRKVNSSESVHVGDHIIVVGGGNSAIDAARTARRLGAGEVHILYRRQIQDMPAQREEIHAAEEEGIAIYPLVSPVEIAGSDGAVKEVVCQRMALGVFDSSGRRRPAPIPDNSFSLEADQVIVAIGQSTDLPFRGGAKAGVEVSKEGLIRIKKGTCSSTNNPSVFAGGDVVTGPGTVVRAIAAGHRAAREIHQALSGREEDLSLALTFADKVEIPMKADEKIVEWHQEQMNMLDIKDRISTFLEVEKGYTGEQALRESCRCLRCDIREEDEAEEGPPLPNSIGFPHAKL